MNKRSILHINTVLRAAHAEVAAVDENRALAKSERLTVGWAKYSRTKL